MVVIFLPATVESGVEQDRTAVPFTCTVHAPHWPRPQPNLVPVRPMFSRITHSSGMSGLASTSYFLPLTSKEIIASSFGNRDPCLPTEAPQARRWNRGLAHRSAAGAKVGFYQPGTA